MKRTIRANFDESAGTYAAYEAETDHFSTLAERLATELATQYDGTITRLLDAGAGTGASSSPLAARSERVIPLDVSRQMLRQNSFPCRVQGDFDTLPFQTGSFDAVAFTASLFLTPSPEAALEEARRVLSEEGVVGAVAPEGWYIDGTSVFEQVDRDSRSPARRRQSAKRSRRPSIRCLGSGGRCHRRTAPAVLPDSGCCGAGVSQAGPTRARRTRPGPPR
ncbi:class I SAM-dependent methyltransferase [Halovenus salina]|uniref:Class I SAM-dependent methyltransferase n=1 Tax=Halovenus salina TaxID=1510225 RepID=A0ABD5W2T3_9EURY